MKNKQKKRQEYLDILEQIKKLDKNKNQLKIYCPSHDDESTYFIDSETSKIKEYYNFYYVDFFAAWDRRKMLPDINNDNYNENCNYSFINESKDGEIKTYDPKNSASWKNRHYCYRPSIQYINR